MRTSVASSATNRNILHRPPVDRFVPDTLSVAVELSLVENPNVTAAMYGIDVSYLQLKVAEGALLETRASGDRGATDDTPVERQIGGKPVKWGTTSRALDRLAGSM